MKKKMWRYVKCKFKRVWIYNVLIYKESRCFYFYCSDFIFLMTDKGRQMITENVTAKYSEVQESQRIDDFS